jgi:hypothetical protein
MHLSVRRYFFDRRPHVCFVFLNSQTYLHQVALKNQWEETGATACRIDFPKNTFSLESTTYIDSSSSEIYTDKKSLEFHVESSRSRAIFIQSPYTEHYPDWFLEFGIDNNLAYAGYGISLSDYTEGQFNTPLIKSSRYLLASGEYEMNGFKEITQSNSQIIFTGNPKMYQIRQSLKNPDKLNCLFIPRLLWAPHWSKFWLEGKRGFARWQMTVKPILEFARNNDNVQIIVRPHPILREAFLAYTTFGQKDLNRESTNSLDAEVDSEYLEDFKHLLSLNNVQLSGSSLAEDVLSSSHLLTEGVSIIAYWATTGKPILVITDDESPQFNSDGKRLLDQIEKAKNEFEISNWLANQNFVSESEKSNSLIDVSYQLHPTFRESPAQMFRRHLR